jgi:DNA-binding NtrC family response regulator
MATRPTILLVDDEPSVLLTYSMILKQNGYDVSGASSAREARAAIDSRRFDLLVCDLGLDRDNGGFEVVAYARAKHPATPAILLTGYATREAAEEAERKHIIMLLKPVEIQDLLSSISGLARKAS